MAATNGNLVLCVEDELYRTYLEQAFAGAGTPCTSVAVENLAQTISESPSGILLLQSETSEQNLIELSSRLKRLFGQEICVLLLSADYLTGEEAGSSVDAFLQFPVGIDEVHAALATLRDTSRRDAETIGPDVTGYRAVRPAVYRRPEHPDAARR